MTNIIEKRLLDAGYLEKDVKLAQKLTKRGLQSHYAIIENVKRCERCHLAMECYGQREDVPIVTTNRVLATGPWNSPLMIIGSMPGEDEGRFSTPFIGAEGQLLTMILAKAGIDRNAVYMTYALKCASMVEPNSFAIQKCHEHIKAEIEAVNPKVILTLGEYAMLSLNPNGRNVANVRGYEHAYGSADVVNTHDMKHLLGTANQQEYKSEVWEDVSLAVRIVKEKSPHYNFDRVGLSSL